MTAMDIDAALGVGRYVWRGRLVSAAQLERSMAARDRDEPARQMERERRAIEQWRERHPVAPLPPPRRVDHLWRVAVQTPVVVGAAAIAFNDAAARRARWYNLGPEAFGVEPALVKLVRLRLDPHFQPTALWRSALEAELRADRPHGTEGDSEGSLYDQLAWWKPRLRDDAVAIRKVEEFIASTVRTWLPRYLAHLARSMRGGTGGGTGGGAAPVDDDVKFLYRLLRMARHHSWARVAAGGGG